MIIEGATVEDAVGHAAKGADLGVGAAHVPGGDIGIDLDRGATAAGRGGGTAAGGAVLVLGHEAAEVEDAEMRVTVIDAGVGRVRGREVEEVGGGGIEATAMRGVWIERIRVEVRVEKKARATTQKMAIVRIVYRATKRVMIEGTMIVEAIVMTTVIIITMIKGIVDTWTNVI